MIMHKEKIHIVHGFEVLIDGETTPTQNHQIFDELLDKERELGVMLRFQRDMEGRIP